jgi:hypothetical protein
MQKLEGKAGFRRLGEPPARPSQNEANTKKGPAKRGFFSLRADYSFAM